jgi:hypothetical protein
MICEQGNDIEDLVESIMQADPERWDPFEKATALRGHESMLKIAAALDPEVLDAEIYMNNRYQVFVHKAFAPEGWPPMIHLSIKRLDKAHIHDWRDLQRIKNELVGKEHEAVELFPAESRLVDAANQYHLYVLATPQARFPFGFSERWVSNTSEFNSVQRPFPKSATPPDCQTLADYARPKV